jgi:hypothetical protein
MASRHSHHVSSYLETGIDSMSHFAVVDASMNQPLSVKRVVGQVSMSQVLFIVPVLASVDADQPLFTACVIMNANVNQPL